MTTAKLPEEYKEKAIANNLSISTVYRRLGRGWGLERACTEKPLNKNYPKDREINSFTSDRPRNAPISFRYYDDAIEKLNEAVANSGLSRSEFLAIIVEEYVNNYE